MKKNNPMNLEELSKQQELLQHHLQQTHKQNIPYSPVGNYKRNNQLDPQIGIQTLKEGKVGVLLIAGGQGTRLQFKGPKGKFPISVVHNKTLFQLFAEKVNAASHVFKHLFPLAIMTSPSNHKETVEYFKKNDYFGLDPIQQLTFYQQKTLPILNSKGDPVLDASGQIAVGPDGNGLALHQFYESGIYKKWQNLGVNWINFVLIDNPLADPFDPYLLAHHILQQAQITIKCIERKDSNEKVGVVVNTPEGIRVVEYTELSNDARYALSADGALKHRCANISLFCFSIDFIKQIAEQGEIQLPLHIAHKAIPYLDENGYLQIPDHPNAFKFEYFIFDLLSMTQKTELLLSPRETTFAPLKNADGKDSPKSVQKALQAFDLQAYKEHHPTHLPSLPFELDPELYYSKWI